jgi:nickel-type superoxide dismutase maturation protease
MAVAAVALVRLLRPLRRVEVHGDSMRPTYRPGDRLLVMRRVPGRPVRAGAVVAVRDPRVAGRVLVKRVEAWTGDGVWVRGDNEAASTDSRHFGALPPDRVLGTVVRRYATSAVPSRADGPGHRRAPEQSRRVHP